MSEPNGPTQQAAYERELKHRNRELGLKKQELAQKEHNDQITLIVTLASVFVALVSVVVGIWFGIDSSENQKKSVDAQIAAMQLDERPYVSTKYEGMQPNVFSLNEGTNWGFRPAPQVALVINGRTPALNVKVYSECTLQDKEGLKGTEHPPTDRLTDDIGTVFTGDKVSAHCNQLLPWKEKTWEAVTYSGHISYDDLTKKHHDTYFCYVASKATKDVSRCVQASPT